MTFSDGIQCNGKQGIGSFCLAIGDPWLVWPAIEVGILKIDTGATMAI
jgi:hypothetical protein